MFVARTEEDYELLRQIEMRFGGGSTPSQTKPVRERVPLTDSEYDSVRGAIAGQVAPLRDAYLRGMAIARSDEQREVLDALHRLIGPPRDS